MRGHNAVLFSMRRVVTTLLFTMRGHNGRFVRHAEGRHDPFVFHADGKTVTPRSGTSPEGAEGTSRPREHPGGASPDNINESEKERKVTFVHGNPLRPCGPPPLQGGGVLSPDG